MKVVYANTRSANCNLLTLVTYFDNEDIELFAITETWFQHGFALNIPNYVFTGSGNRIGAWRRWILYP